MQIARHLGAEVAGVCRVRNFELVRTLGVSETIDYSSDDFAARGARYDLIFDVVGRSSAAPAAPALALGGRFLTITKGGPSEAAMKRDLATLAELAEEGALRTAIDRIFPLEQIVEAHRHVESGQKHGNVVIEVG